MNILFIHQNFPAQFKHLATMLAADSGHIVFFLTTSDKLEITGVRKLLFQEDDLGFMSQTDKAIALGTAAAERLQLAVDRDGLSPNVIVVHAGFGLSLYLKQLFPKVPIIGYFEWFFSDQMNHFHLEPNLPASPAYNQATTERNQLILRDLDQCDFGLTPTHFQAGQFPEAFHHRLSIIHDGIQTSVFKPSESPVMELEINGSTLDPQKTPLVTFVSRGLEPLRGFPEFLRAWERIQELHSTAKAIIVGFDRSFYSEELPEGQTYKSIMHGQLSLYPDRLVYTGALSYQKYQELLRASSVHVYLTRPFVPSWSLLEALASGCAVVGSDNKAVSEFIQHEQTGLLVDSTDAESLSLAIMRLLNNADLARQLGRQARLLMIRDYDLAQVAPKQLKLILGAGLIHQKHYS